MKHNEIDEKTEIRGDEDEEDTHNAAWSTYRSNIDPILILWFILKCKMLEKA